MGGGGLEGWRGEKGARWRSEAVDGAKHGYRAWIGGWGGDYDLAGVLSGIKYLPGKGVIHPLHHPAPYKTLVKLYFECVWITRLRKFVITANLFIMLKLLTI